ncbi:MAG: class I SAM-dependent methyltransferase [Chroococcales cyanobacterium]
MTFEQQSGDIREKIQKLAAEALEQSNPSGWFDTLYAEAKGNVSQIPWAKLSPHPYLEDWLQRYCLDGNDRCALVIGCGLGDDAEALSDRHFQVTAFDISPTAIEWCHSRFPDSKVSYSVEDLFALPSDWQYQFDFVFESRNIQALPLTVRSTVIEAIASLVRPGGTLLLIDHWRDTDTPPEGPPWALSDTELAHFEKCGLEPVRRDIFPIDNNNTAQLIRCEYHRISDQS